jgi:hypothetical protein
MLLNVTDCPAEIADADAVKELVTGLRLTVIVRD